jgi:receptor protein-tyrosine kinase
MEVASRVSRRMEHPVAGVLRRRWWMVALAWVLTVASAAIFTARQPPVYRASTSLAVVPDAAIEDAADVLRSLDTLDRRTIIATLARLPSTPEVRSSASAAAGLSPDDLTRYTVLGGVVPNTNIIKIDVDGADPARTAAFANAVAGVLGTMAPQLYRIFTLRVIERAVPRTRPVAPDMRRNLAVGAIVGLLVGAAAAAVGDYLRRTGP